MPDLTYPKYGLELVFIAEGGYAEWDRRGLCRIVQKEAMRSWTDGTMYNGAEGVLRIVARVPNLT